MKQKSPTIWVLVDNRAGTANQAIELAEKLGVPFEIKHVEYNAFGKLPNALLSLFPIHIKKSILSQLTNQPSPEIIISAGRKAASLAVHLRKLSQNKAKIIQIMRPNINYKKFELIILPQHDVFNYALPNIVRILGALTNVQEKCTKMQSDFEDKYPKVSKCIAVLIGGSTKNYTLTLDNAKFLADRLTAITNNHSLPLFITFSRRTPENVKKYFQENFLWPNIIYDPSDTNSLNPYPVILQKAEYIISTTDSISMCSEAASMGKPVYVFCPDNLKLKKHNFFIQQLVDLGIVRRLMASTNYLEKYEYTPLSELKRVADLIKDKIL